MHIIYIYIVNRRPWENRLNWIPDPDPSPSRDQSRREEEENRPPVSQSLKMPRKIRPRRRKREHRQHHIPGPNENAPGIDLQPREMRRIPVKHPQPPQLPQHPRPAANKNLSRVNPWNQLDPGRLYKQAPRSRGNESTKRSRRDYFSESSPSYNSKRPRRDYFSGSSSKVCKGPDAELVPQPQAPQGCTQAGPQGRAIALQQSGCHSAPYLPQSPLRAALPDSVIEVGLEPPVVASTSRIPSEDLPPVTLEIPSGSPELEELPESHQCPDTPGKWFQPPTQSPKRPRSKSPPSPRRPRKHFSSFGRWCE